MRLSLLLFSIPVLCWAQTGTGNIQGTVKDVGGAVVPKAKVTIVHSATTRQYPSETNDVGFFLVPALQTGSYQITVESPGMETWKGGLNLLAGQSAQVDPVLKPGATTTSVTVAGDVTPLITTTSPTIATVVERERIEQLPLNGRFITTLLYMTTPGVESGSVPRVYGLRTPPSFCRTAPSSKIASGSPSPRAPRGSTPSPSSVPRPTILRRNSTAPVRSCSPLAPDRMRSTGRCSKPPETAAWESPAPARTTF